MSRKTPTAKHIVKVLCRARLALTMVALASAASSSAAAPQKVFVGMYVLNITELDMKAGTYQGDFYVWFRWTGSLSPTAFEIMNGSETTKERNYYSVTNGVKYAVYRCQSKLNRVFDFRSYPLDSHTLAIDIEDGQRDNVQLVYEPDPGNSRIQPEMRLAGWEIGQARAYVRSWIYPTNYGDPETAPDYRSTYSRFVMEIPISHRGIGIYLKSFLPLFISVAIALLSLFVAAGELEVRVGLAVAGIFGAVSSQLVVAGALPDTPHLTLSDKVHIISLFFIFAALVISCAAFRLAGRDRHAAAARLDGFSRWAIPLGYGIVISLVSTFR